MTGDPTDLETEHRVHATYWNYFRCVDENGHVYKHPYLRAGLGLSKKLVQSMARFRLSCSNIRAVSGRRHNIAYEDRVCLRCTKLGLEQAPMDDEGHLLFRCMSTEHIRNSNRYLHLPLRNARLYELMPFEDTKGVSNFVYECMSTLDI